MNIEEIIGSGAIAINIISVVHYPAREPFTVD